MPSTVKEYEYEAESKHVAAQDTALTNIRHRAVGLLTMASILISFSTAIGLVSTDPTRNNIVPRWASIPLLCMLFTMACIVLWIQLPSGWHAATSSQKFDLASIDVQAEHKKDQELAKAAGKELDKTVDDLAVDIALGSAIAKLREDARNNETILRRRQAWLTVCQVIFLAQLILLVVAVLWSK